MTSQTADEVKAAFVQSFPAGAGELAYEIWRSIAHLHLKWKDYRALFGTSQERIDLLNRTAPAFFGHLDQILRHDVALAITRLTDTAGSGMRTNASLARMIEMLTPHVDRVMLTQWQADVQDLNAATERLRALRNRFLAHEDVATALKYHPDPLPGFSRADIEDILARIRALFGQIEMRFRGVATAHEHIFARSAEQLVFALEQAVAHRKCERAEFKRKYGVDLAE